MNIFHSTACSNLVFHSTFSKKASLRLYVLHINPPLDPAQHSDSCKSETENDLAEMLQVILNGSKYCQIIAQLYSGGLLRELGTQLSVLFDGKWSQHRIITAILLSLCV